MTGLFHASALRTGAMMLVMAAMVFCAWPKIAHAACAAPAGVAADIVYDTTNKIMVYCNGTNWVRMNQPGTGSGGCAASGMAEGEIAYNTDERVMQICAGSNTYAAGLVGGANGWAQMSVGGGFTCGIKADGTLHCWAVNGNGQLGDGTTTTSITPVAVSGGGVWKQVSAGSVHTCAIKSDDTLHCWGSNANGRTGLNTSAGNTLVPTGINGGGTWKQVAAGVSHSCAIKSDDSLWCWGLNTNGQLGDNSLTQRLVPTAISGGGTWKQVTAHAAHTCAIKSDDTLHCWGGNANGRTGQNTSTGNTIVPTGISGGGTWKQVSLGNTHGCAIKSDDTLHCWGNNASGQLGDNTTTQQLVPTAVSGGGSWKKIAAGYEHNCAIKADDTLHCWGSNTSGQIGNGTMANILVPTAIFGGGTWQLVGSGGNSSFSHSCAISTNNIIHCWGSNSSGRLGVGSWINTLEPVAIAGGGTWKMVAAGGTLNVGHTCAIKSDDKLYCWGTNANGRTGLNTTVGNTFTPTEVFGGGTWKQVHMGLEHGCAIKLDDTLYCWGRNANGRTGQNTAAGDTIVPTQVSGGGSWKQVAAGDAHTCAIKMDDTLHCWGTNANGKTGLNTTVGDTLVPTAVSGGGSWKQVEAGYQHTCAIKTDDTLYCWGPNSNGQLGDNSTTERIVPTAVSGGGTWKQVTAGGSQTVPHTCGIKSDDTMHCWGVNGNGQAGDGTTTTPYLVPSPTSGGATWKYVDAGHNHTCAVKSDDTLWCWGWNSSGQAGDGVGTLQLLVPTAVYGGGTWLQPSGGQHNTCAVSLQGGIFCWGLNSTGQGTSTESSLSHSLTATQTWCGQPDGKEGTLIYNSDFNIMQYCDGAGWVGIMQ